MENRFLTWAEVEEAIKSLSEKIKLSDYRAIVAPNRGALCVASMLQYHQDITLLVHTDEDVEPEDKIFKITSDTRGKLLFLNDMVDTGQSISDFIGRMIRIKLDFIKNKRRADDFLFDFDIAVLVDKNHGSLNNVKNFQFGLQLDTNNWIWFPWEFYKEPDYQFYLDRYNGVKK